MAEFAPEFSEVEQDLFLYFVRGKNENLGKPGVRVLARVLKQAVEVAQIQEQSYALTRFF